VPPLRMLALNVSVVQWSLAPDLTIPLQVLMPPEAKVILEHERELARIEMEDIANARVLAVAALDRGGKVAETASEFLVQEFRWLTLRRAEERTRRVARYSELSDGPYHLVDIRA
jgi:hypothetical protein